MTSTGSMQRRTWRELSSGQKAAIIGLGAVQVALAGAAWIELARRPATTVRGPKGVWALAIAVNFIGPISYFAVGRRTQAELTG